MAILPIITAPDPRLKLIAKPVAKVDDGLRRFLDDLLETMYVSEGIGLAATQVGDLRRALVIDISQKEGTREPMFIVNPEITWESDEENIYLEGCLSLPGQYAEVVRPKKVKVKFLDYDGQLQEIEADELLATCIQHEIDHLDGLIFVDHISPVKRDIILRKLKKEKRLAAANA
jgi:peptide deformylase